jgi:hypothetical protein
VWNNLAGRFAGVLAAAIALSAGLCSSQAAELSATEQRWLKHAQPVLAFARAQQLPLDIVVQPQPSPGAAPLAMAFIDGRCKLVLSMRGNPEAQATLDRLEPTLLAATIELMTAHELGHCRRYLDGAWYALPAGFSPATPESVPENLRAAYADMQAARREEAYGDLVGLAWTQQQHPQQYDALHAWLMAERSQDRIPGSHHDTLAWLQLARNGVGAERRSIFAASAAMWQAGLNLDD